MKKIVCLGDSLTEGADLEKSCTWTALVENAVGIEVFNQGIGGDCTGGMLSRFCPGVLPLEPDVVIILGGTNDLWWDLRVNTILANVFSIACQARYHGVAPVVGLPPPIFKEAAQRRDFAPPMGGYDACLEKLSSLIKALERAAEENEVPILDFYHPFFNEEGEVAGEFFLDDGLHPNKEGHRLMAIKIVAFLRSNFLVGGATRLEHRIQPRRGDYVEKC